jgi:hypothetical protein
MVYNFFGTYNIELFDCENEEVRRAHAKFVFMVFTTRLADMWVMYLWRVLAAEIGFQGSCPLVFPFVNFLGTLFPTHAHSIVTQQIVRAPEIFLLANVATTEEEGESVSRFFTALFQTYPADTFNVGPVAEVVANARPEQEPKLRLLLLWCAALGPELREPVAAAFDDFERMFLEVEHPSTLLTDVFNELIFVQAYD